MVDDSDQKQSSLPAIFSAEEAAERLKLTKRAVITHGKRYGLCAVYGRRVIFTEQQLVELLEAMRYKPSSPTEERYSSTYAGHLALRRLRAKLESTQAEGQRKQQERRDQLAREREARRQREAAEREERLQVKRQAAIAKREAKFANAQQKEQEHLDENSRDPAYWTPERKRLLRQRRLARLETIERDGE